MSLPFVTQARFICNYVAIRKLCTERFGKAHEVKHSKKTGQKIDNHGNWEVTAFGKVAFRYEKDLILFMLLVSHLADPPVEPRVRTILR